MHKIGNTEYQMLPCKREQEVRVPESHHSSVVPGIYETHRKRAPPITSICVLRAC